MKNNVLYTINIALRLVAICAIIALLVATVNYYTAPVIKANAEETKALAISTLFDGAEVTTSACDAHIPDEYNGIVDEVLSITSSDGETLGYCVSLSPTCFKGEVDIITAFDCDGFIKGVEITSTNDETSGIGTKVADKSFTSRFIESSGQPVSTNVDDYIITAATKTSKPVTQAIFAAKSVVSDMMLKEAE